MITTIIITIIIITIIIMMIMIRFFGSDMIRLFNDHAIKWLHQLTTRLFLDDFIMLLGIAGNIESDFIFPDTFDTLNLFTYLHAILQLNILQLPIPNHRLLILRTLELFFNNVYTSFQLVHLILTAFNTIEYFLR